VTRRFLRAAALFFLLAALVVPQAIFADTAATGGQAPGRLIVAFSERNLAEAQARGRLARFGARLERWLPELGFARVSVPVGLERAVAQRLESDRGIRFVTEDRKYLLVADAPLDQHWGNQWGPQKVGLPAARAFTRGDPAVVIAIVDSGVNYNHWDLREQMWVNPGESELNPATGARTCVGGIAENGLDDDGNGYVDDCRGYDFAPDGEDNDPRDELGHGTFVAGIAGAATNNPGSHTDGTYEGIAGMGGASRLMPVRVLDVAGVGSAFNIVSGIRYAVNNGASVINLSLAYASAPPKEDREMLCDAIDYAQGHDVMVIGASGNGSSLTTVSYPAACPGVIAVGASTDTDERASFSNAGPRLDLFAPGQGIFSTMWPSDSAYGYYGKYGTGNGTSFAAPHVAGAAALIRGLRKDLSQEQVRGLLLDNADDLGGPSVDPFTDWRRLNAAQAVQAAASFPRPPLYLPFITNP
jgi:subtilisin family serine protease